MSVWLRIHRPPDRHVEMFQKKWKEADERGDTIAQEGERRLTKGVSFGPQMRASQAKKSDSEIGPVHTPSSQLAHARDDFERV